MPPGSFHLHPAWVVFLDHGLLVHKQLFLEEPCAAACDSSSIHHDYHLKLCSHRVQQVLGLLFKEK